MPNRQGKLDRGRLFDRVLAVRIRRSKFRRSSFKAKFAKKNAVPSIRTCFFHNLPLKPAGTIDKNIFLSFLEKTNLIDHAKSTRKAGSGSSLGPRHGDPKKLPSRRSTCFF